MSVETTVPTGDDLRPTATRASGMRAWVWYALIAVLATVGIVYLTSAFIGVPPPVTPSSSTTTTTTQAKNADTWIYDGTAVDARGPTAHPRGQPSALPANASHGAPAAVPGLPTVNAAQQVYGTIVRTTGGETAPDTSGSQWATRAYPLPTPAPDDAALGGFGSASHRSDGRQIQIVYGAPATASTPIGAAVVPASLAPTPDPIVPGARSAPGDPAPLPAAANGGALVGQGAETMPAMRRAPSAAYLVAAGTRIDAQLDVAVQSDIPGPLTAHVVTSVIDSLSGQVLIPAGTVVLGTYTGLGAGQSRLSIVWTRLIFPDRSSFTLAKAPALGEEGQVGEDGRLDDHRGQLFRSTFIGAILATIFQRLTGTAPSTTTNVYITSPGAGSTSASAQMIYDLATKLNSQTANLPVTISVGASSPILIYVDRDMRFEGPYRPMAPAAL
jgi:type IV secretory pathway VirB10-like protein